MKENNALRKGGDHWESVVPDFVPRSSKRSLTRNAKASPNSHVPDFLKIAPAPL
jgi:hypothetical protein